MWNCIAEVDVRTKVLCCALVFGTITDPCRLTCLSCFLWALMKPTQRFHLIFSQQSEFKTYVKYNKYFPFF